MIALGKAGVTSIQESTVASVEFYAVELNRSLKRMSGPLETLQDHGEFIHHLHPSPAKRTQEAIETEAVLVAEGFI